MIRRNRVLAGGLIAILAVAAIGSGIAARNMTDDNDEPITGPAYDRAVEAALAHTGGGTVTETEIGDDGAAYGVEILLDDGSQVEVNLDEDFNVIGQEADDDEGEGEDDD